MADWLALITIHERDGCGSFILTYHLTSGKVTNHSTTSEEAMKTMRQTSFFWQITCTILLILVSVLALVVFEMEIRLFDADQTSMRMCSELGRIVAHTQLPKKYIFTVPVFDFIERGAYRRNWNIPLLDWNRDSDIFKEVFETSLQSERRRISHQSRAVGSE